LSWTVYDVRPSAIDVRSLQDLATPICADDLGTEKSGPHSYDCDVTLAVRNWFAAAIPMKERGFIMRFDPDAPNLSLTTRMTFRIDHHEVCTQNACPSL
jgi:hypothetical protein